MCRADVILTRRRGGCGDLWASLRGPEVGTDDRFSSSVNYRVLAKHDRPRKAMVCPTGFAQVNPDDLALRRVASGYGKRETAPGQQIQLIARAYYKRCRSGCGNPGSDTDETVTIGQIIDGQLDFGPAEV